MEHSEHNQERTAAYLNRRRVLQSIGAVGVAGIIGTGPVTAGGGEAPCECPDGTVAWGKYEFEECEFVFEKGENFELDGGGFLVEITNWTSKDGEDCEPVTVEYDVADGYTVTQICAFGGTDTEITTDSDGTYDSDLETDGGQRAAISHLTFCLGEAFGGYQIDLIYGDPIEQFDPESDVTYDDENRLLQDYWSGDGLGTHHFKRNSDAYQGCWEDFDNTTQTDAIPTFITLENGQASACVNPDDAECLDDFALVSYGAPGHQWDPDTADQQELWDADTTGTVDEEDGTVCFEVDIPPTE